MRYLCIVCVALAIVTIQRSKFIYIFKFQTQKGMKTRTCGGIWNSASKGKKSTRRKSKFRNQGNLFVSVFFPLQYLRMLVNKYHWENRPSGYLQRTMFTYWTTLLVQSGGQSLQDLTMNVFDKRGKSLLFNVIASMRMRAFWCAFSNHLFIRTYV